MNRTPRGTIHFLAPAAFASLACGSLIACGGEWEKVTGRKSGRESTDTASADGSARLKYDYRKSGNTTRAYGADGAWIATFTQGARSVNLLGPTRLLNEASARFPISSNIWVRTLELPFANNPSDSWLDAALSANAHKRPDVLAISMQYVVGAPAVFDGGLQIAGDASYGPVDATTGSRLPGSDVADYVQSEQGTGVRSTEAIDPTRTRSLDCSGFVRMVFGYRNNFPGAAYKASLPLSAKVTRIGSTPFTEVALPRTAEDIFYAGPGKVIVADSGSRPSASVLAALLPGDLVFFRADNERDTRLDHVGIFVGLDAGGHLRFVSSRKSADGPTLGDTRGASILDGEGLYADAFRAVRRL